MRCLTAGLVLLLSFSIVVCVPSCTSCSKSKKERVERQVTTDNEIPINDQNIDSRPGWNLSQQDVNRNTIEKPNYSNTLHTSDTDISSVLNSGEILKDIPIEEYSEDHRKHCPECHNGSVERINSHKHVGCVCALFTTPFADDAPLISKTFHNVSCHHHVSEEDACTRVCLSLAVFYYKVKDNLICSHAHNATDLMASLHTKVCNANSKWIFTGLVTNQPICCHNGKPVMCDTEVHDGKMSDIIESYTKWVHNRVVKKCLDIEPVNSIEHLSLECNVEICCVMYQTNEMGFFDIKSSIQRQSVNVDKKEERKRIADPCVSSKRKISPVEI